MERHSFTIVQWCKNMNVVQVAAGNELSMLLTDEGDVYTSGYNDMGNTQFSQS